MATRGPPCQHHSGRKVTTPAFNTDPTRRASGRAAGAGWFTCTQYCALSSRYLDDAFDLGE
jgi:hypothetical protein